MEDYFALYDLRFAQATNETAGGDEALEELAWSFEDYV